MKDFRRGGFQTLAALVLLCGSAASPRAEEQGCSRGWKAYAAELAGDSRAPDEKLTEASTAWADEFLCVQKKELLEPACQEGADFAEPPRRIRKKIRKACKALKAQLDTAYDLLKPSIEEAREEEEASAEAGRPGPPGELTEDFGSQAETAEGFAKGVETLVHWYHRAAGSSLDAAVKDLEKMRRAKSKLDLDIEDAYQLGMSKSEKKAKQRESKALKKEIKAQKKIIASERKKFRKATSSKLEKWAKGLRKAFKAKERAKDLCACAP